jgi:RNase P/RNase MRP subunit p30
MRWVKVYRFQQISKLRVRVCNIYKIIVTTKAKSKWQNIYPIHMVLVVNIFSFTLSLAYGFKW